MTTNDSQIDVLLRRYARHSQSTSATEHLDADELSAFAEGSLPDAARARYVSHLVDCNSCRQIVSQLAISSGAVVAAEASTARDASGYSWWQRLSGFFAPPTLRYAAFAMVLITVAGVVFLVTRRPREFNMVAQNEQAKQGPGSAVKPLNDTTPQTNTGSQADGNENKPGPAIQPGSVARPSPSSDQILKLDASRSGDYPPSPPKPAKEGEVTSSSSLAASKKAAPFETESAPSYAPPPPVAGQRAETQSRQQQNVAGAGSGSGPRQSQQQPVDTFKMPDRGREAEAGKENREDDKSHIAMNQSPASKRAGDEKVKGPRRDLENNAAMNRNSNEVRDEASRTQGALAVKPSASEEKPPETRSAGGRKFKRQGNAWVDAKFKSAMTLKSVSRGSSEFDALDSGLRSIAQQLGGQIIVVWKNKAYLIR
jgi:hypothetical protein